MENHSAADIPFFKPDISEAEIQRVITTLRSGWLTTGPNTLEFEQSFAEMAEADFAIAVNSGTAGLHLACEVAGLQRDELAIVPAMTFAASSEILFYLNAEPVFIDVDPITLNISAELLRKYLETNCIIKDKTCIHRETGRTIRLIIVVHYGGLPCDMDGILEVAREFHLTIIEDAAHAFPATYKGRAVGSIGDLTVFSFYANKTITTCEGGMVCTQRQEWADRMRILRLHGMSKDAFKRYTNQGKWYYEIIERGYKYNMPDVLAAIGIEQLKRAEKMRQQRENIANQYNKNLQHQLPLLLPQKNPFGTHAWHLYPVRLTPDCSKTREELIQFLSHKQIGTSVHFIPLHLMPFYQQKYNFREMDFPNAYQAYKQLVSLPIYSLLSEQEINRIIAAIQDFFSL